MDDRKFFLIILMMFLFPFVAACEKKEVETVETEVYLSENTNAEMMMIKEDEQKNEYDDNDISLISEAQSCKKTEYTISYTNHFPSDFDPLEIPETMDIVYYNSSLNADMITEGKLVEKGVDDADSWVETMECELIFISDGENEGIWKINSSDSVYLPIDSEFPTWDGYEADVLKITGNDGFNYKIEEAKWKGEAIENEGYFERKAVYVFQRFDRGYYGIYEGTAFDIVMDGADYFFFDASDDELLSDYRQRNSDVYGIVRISGTNLNHPVMKCFEDEDFYLWHDLDKNYNTRGVPFVETGSDFEKSRGNTVIYGHRAENDVFGELYKYEDAEYCKQHPIVETVSEKGNQKWLITACFLVCNSDEDAFDYSDEGAFMTVDGFEKYMAEVEKRNFYITDYEFGINDTYLTLSSCSKEKTGDGTNRIALLAVRIPYDSDVSEAVASIRQNEDVYLPEKMRDKD